MNAHAEQLDFEKRKQLAAEWSKTTPLILVHRMGRRVLARVVWAKTDRIRVRRWVGVIGHEYTREPETILWASFAGMPDTQAEPAAQAPPQQLLSA